MYIESALSFVNNLNTYFDISYMLQEVASVGKYEIKIHIHDKQAAQQGQWDIKVLATWLAKQEETRAYMRKLNTG